MQRLLNALRALLRPNRGAVIPEWGEDLRDRLAALEAVQTARELEWVDTRDRLLKYLRRLEGGKARDKQLAEQRQDDGYAQAKSTVLAMKFNRNAGS